MQLSGSNPYARANLNPIFAIRWYQKFAFTLVLVAFCCLVSTRAQETALLGTPVRGLKVKTENIHLALNEIANEYNVPIGLESVAGVQKERPISLEIQEGTLRDVLVSIVKQDPQYDWAEREGVINVFPVQNRDRFLKDLLATNIKAFHVGREASRFDVRVYLTNLPEVRRQLKQSGVTPSLGAYSNRDFVPLGKEFSLEISNVSLRTILNSIVVKSSSKYWVVNHVKTSIVVNF